MCSTIVDSVVACLDEGVAACLADRFASALVFILGGDVADGGRETHVVVVGLDLVEFGLQFGAVADFFQVWPFAFDVSEQGFDPGLVLVIPNSG